jgi:hypothetical protein
MLIKIILEAAEVKKALLFVNKKKQKNFDSLKHLALPVTNPAGIRRFLLLFFKKEALSCVPNSQLVTHSATILAGIGAGDEDAGIVIDHNGLTAAMRLFDVLDHVPLGGQYGA